VSAPRRGWRVAWAGCALGLQKPQGCGSAGSVCLPQLTGGGPRGSHAQDRRSAHCRAPQPPGPLPPSGIAYYTRDGAPGSGAAPVLFLHGVGGLVIYLGIVRQIARLEGPVIAVDIRHVGMRLRCGGAEPWWGLEGGLGAALRAAPQAALHTAAPPIPTHPHSTPTPPPTPPPAPAFPASTR
jgi:hypothetical protein